jgi:hypothetical protein
MVKTPLVPLATPPPFLLAPRTLTLIAVSCVCCASACHMSFGMVQTGLTV